MYNTRKRCDVNNRGDSNIGGTATTGCSEGVSFFPGSVVGADTCRLNPPSNLFSQCTQALKRRMIAPAIVRKNFSRRLFGGASVAINFQTAVIICHDKLFWIEANVWTAWSFSATRPFNAQTRLLSSWTFS